MRAIGVCLGQKNWNSWALCGVGQWLGLWEDGSGEDRRNIGAEVAESSTSRELWEAWVKAVTGVSMRLWGGVYLMEG